MAKEIPILFSTPMVQAIIDGRKSQTRRVVKPQPDVPAFHEDETGAHAMLEIKKGMFTDNLTWWMGAEWGQQPCGAYPVPKCPYGKPGDILWVRETHYRLGIWEKNGKTKTGRQKWVFKATQGAILFEENKPTLFRKSRHKERPEKEMWYKRLARFMPKSASRFDLEVTDVKVERVQSISREDAVAEGCPGYRPTQDEPMDQFKRLWEDINGKESWESNPWVWAVSFKVLSTIGKP